MIIGWVTGNKQLIHGGLTDIFLVIIIIIILAAQEYYYTSAFIRNAGIGD